MTAWGIVTDATTSAVEVRFAGDDVSTPVGLKASGLALSTNDKVLMVRAGSAWVIVCKLGAT